MGKMLNHKLLWTNQFAAQAAKSDSSTLEARVTVSESDISTLETVKPSKGATFINGHGVYIDGAGELQSLTASSTELNHVVGGTSAFQDQIDTLADDAITDHGSLTGLGDDDHPQYSMKNTEDVDVALCSDGAGGTQAGPMYLDTSLGLESYASPGEYFHFPGHFAQYLWMTNDSTVAIEKGDLVVLTGTTYDTVNKVVRRSATYNYRPFGVALDDFTVDTTGRIAYEGFCDAKSNTSGTTIRNIYSAQNIIGQEHMVAIGSTIYSLGLSYTGAGTSYWWDGTTYWVRLQLNAQESS